MSWSNLVRISRPALSRGIYSGYSKVSSEGPVGIPENVQEMSEAQQSQHVDDRSREVSGQQKMGMFGGSFMSHQGDLSDDKNVPISENVVQGSKESIAECYEMDSGAHLGSVLQTNVPEPYEPKNEANLKEGIPEGMSDCVRSRGQMWTMEDRIDHSNELIKKSTNAHYH